MIFNVCNYYFVFSLNNLVGKTFVSEAEVFSHSELYCPAANTLLRYHSGYEYTHL